MSHGHISRLALILSLGFFSLFLHIKLISFDILGTVFAVRIKAHVIRPFVKAVGITFQLRKEDTHGCAGHIILTKR